MKEIIKMLDEKLRYINHEIEEKTIRVRVKSKRKKAECPYCGERSEKAHSKSTRKLQDLPIQGKKVIIEIERRKYKCKNPECGHKTYAETFEFYEAKSRKTKRLNEEIMRVALTQSSMSAAAYLRGSVANVGKSTICNMIKKRNEIDDGAK